jgi:hypothetical protein
VTASTAGAARLAAPVTTRTVAATHALVDCLFLAVVTGVSMVTYVGGLGFYYDDYSVLYRMAFSSDQSLFGLYDSVRPATGQRPLQALIFATLYRLFGLEPLGYHLVNAGLLIAIAVLLYLVMRELRLPRLLCVAIPLVYSILPHYATNRFWVNAFQINLSSLFYLLSLYAALRALRARPIPLAGWLTVAFACVAGSLFAYEVMFPLFALNVGLVWWTARRLHGEDGRNSSAWIAGGGLAAVTLVVGMVKLARVAEHGQNDYQVGFQDGFLHHIAYLVSGGIKLNLGTYFVAVPYVLWWVVRHAFSLADLAAAAAAGLLAAGYVWSISQRDRPALAGGRHWRDSMGVGVLAFVLGYAIFLTNQQVLFRSAGIDNRVNAGAALGVAALLVGGTGWLAVRLTERRRPIFFSTVIGCIVAIGVLIIGTLSSFWTVAAKEQEAIVMSFQQAMPRLPSSSTVVLDGVCPESGPAVVFADQWDFRGALRLAYNDPLLRADTATEALRAGPRQLELEMTFLDFRSTRTYDYGPRLFVYDFPRRTLHVLRDRNDALRYVSSRPAFDCLPQRGFAWGLDPSRRLSLP